ncbi:MAG TPA: P-loop NTPase fold protein [Gammaproteobacteria bacterium]|jgi:predicted KAP-like P-loop ATPase|nr:P-loop NTPase fold protein [Gammaproteobacteria bacterium]
MFDADRPILKSHQDRLNRNLFSTYLARCMLDRKETESFVISLYGGWGAGKTSILNLAREELLFASTNLEDIEKPVILYFSPWSYSGQNQLIFSFFRRLSLTLQNTEYFENKERIIHLLELYISYFTYQNIPSAFVRKKPGWKKLIRRKESAWESGQDLTLVKAELNALLQNQKHKIIIMIDNIARLEPKEIKQFFQIIKSIGDFTNTIYLLALDRKIILHALEQTDGVDAKESLEKIIQLSFDVPPILQQDLENLLTDRLSDLITLVPEGLWQVPYWTDIYYSSLKYFFESCRDISRYVNVLAFSYPRLRDTVNPIDFFALTAIEVFLPAVYSGIRDNKDLFSDLLDNVYPFDENEIKKDRLRCDEILSRNTRIPSQILLHLLMSLFPRLRHLYQPGVHFFYSDTLAYTLRHISSPDFFNAYFRLSLQNGNVPSLEFDTILSFASDHDTFNQALTRLNQDDRILKFLDKLDDPRIIQSIPLSHIATIIAAFIENGDLFPQGVATHLTINTPMRIHRIIHQLLQRITRTEERCAILEKAIAESTKSLAIAVQEIIEEGKEHTEETDTFMPVDFRDVTPPQLQSLRQACIARIKAWAKNGSLEDHPRLLFILTAWRQWDTTDACSRYVAKMVQTDRGLLAFLTATLAPAIDQAMTKYEKSQTWEHYLENINSFIPARELEVHAKTLFEDQYFEKLREKEQLALMIFLDLSKANTTKVIPQM